MKDETKKKERCSYKKSVTNTSLCQKKNQNSKRRVLWKTKVHSSSMVRTKDVFEAGDGKDRWKIEEISRKYSYHIVIWHGSR